LFQEGGIICAARIPVISEPVNVNQPEARFGQKRFPDRQEASEWLAS